MTAPFFGYHMPNFTYPGVRREDLFDHVASLATAAEEAGFDMITVMDHFYQIHMVAAEEEPMMEAYTTLGALSQRTKAVRLSALVTGVTYRNPALLAKQVITLDVLSKGRAILGIGAAWNEDEHRGYGFEFPSIGRRMDRLDEALHIIKAMFTEERPTSKVASTASTVPSTRPVPSSPGAPRSWSGAGESRGPCAWWLATRTFPTGSVGRMTCGAREKSWSGTVPKRAVTRAPS